MVPWRITALHKMDPVNGSMTQASIDIFSVIPDPNLESPPDSYVNGSSGEFHYSHQPNAMRLNWTHTAGTPLDLHSTDDGTFPLFNDNVYFTQSFNWPYNDMPTEVIGYLNYSTSLTGDFLMEESGSQMFCLYVWFIDSSGNWRTIYHSNPPYPDTEQYRQLYSSYFDILAGWGGMIEDENGIQEDPLDTLSIGIGLVPTLDFLDSQGTEPWQEYNGSVSFIISYMDIQVVMETEPDPANHLIPLYNVSYKTTLGEVYSLSPLDPSTPLMDSGYDLSTDPTGNVYITGYTSIPYDIYHEIGVSQRHQFLIKYDPMLNRQWIVRNDNGTQGTAIIFNDGYIFTTGSHRYSDPVRRNMIVTKWTTSGTKVWESEWGELYDQIGIALGVHKDGSVYVMVSDYNYVEPPGYQRSNLLKFDSSGLFLWNKSLPLSSIEDVPGSLHVFDSHIFYEIQGLMMTMDLEGNIVWDGAAWGATTDENGTIYAITSQGAGLEINQFDIEGNETWTEYYEVEYPTGWIEFLRMIDIALTPTDELLILYQADFIDDSYFLLKYDTNGTFIESWEIGDDNWPYSTSYSPTMEVASSGLMYLSLNMYSWNVVVQGYVVGEYAIPIPNPDILQLAVIGGGVGMILLVGVYWYRKKQV